MRCLFIMLLLLAGCHTYHPAKITVKTSAGTPIEGAQVASYPMYLFNPTSESILFTGSSEILEPFTAKGDLKFTDAAGQAAIQVIDGSPSQLHISNANNEDWAGIIELRADNTVLLRPVRSNPKLIISAD